MVEPLMFFALGVLSAGLIALVFLPLVHARAVRLTLRRMAGSVPSSITEVQAEKDAQRAAFAVSLRKLEAERDQAREKLAAEQAESGRAKSLAARAALARDEAATACSSAEQTLKDTQGQLERVQAELAERTAALDLASASLTQKTWDYDVVVAEREVLRGELDTALAQAAEQSRRLGQLDAGASAEGTDNDALREQIAQVAAEVIRLTAALEGPDSAINGLIGGAPEQASPATGSAPVSLADRVRALQRRAAAPPAPAKTSPAQDGV